MNQGLLVSALVVVAIGLSACATERTEVVSSSESQFKAVPPPEQPTMADLPYNDDWYEPYQPVDDRSIDDWGGGFDLGGIDAPPPCKSSIETLSAWDRSAEGCAEILQKNATSLCRHYDYTDYLHTDGHTYSCTTTNASAGAIDTLAKEEWTPDGWVPRYECRTDITCTREGRRTN